MTTVPEWGLGELMSTVCLGRGLAYGQVPRHVSRSRSCAVTLVQAVCFVRSARRGAVAPLWGMLMTAPVGKGLERLPVLSASLLDHAPTPKGWFLWTGSLVCSRCYTLCFHVSYLSKMCSLGLNFWGPEAHYILRFLQRGSTAEGFGGWTNHI